MVALVIQALLGCVSAPVGPVHSDQDDLYAILKKECDKKSAESKAEPKNLDAAYSASQACLLAVQENPNTKPFERKLMIRLGRDQKLDHDADIASRLCSSGNQASCIEYSHDLDLRRQYQQQDWQEDHGR